MPINTLLFLSEISLHHGLIGIDEYIERVEVAHWLMDNDPLSVDPRHPQINEIEQQELQKDVSSSTSTSGPSSGIPVNTLKDAPDGWMHFVFMKQWYFTGADPDCYPSVPHGHLLSANRPWPKLNPYTGRVFKEKHTEDKRLRLSKIDMCLLWQDHSFRNFCRQHILWYMETYDHKFAVKYPLRFPCW